MNKVLVYVFIFLVILTLGLLGYHFYSSGSLKGLFFNSPSQDKVDNLPKVEPERYEGEVICLPAKSGADAEEESCVLSLKDKDNMYYALSGENLRSMVQENTSVVMWGKFTQGSYSGYDVVGFIEVVRAEKQ